MEFETVERCGRIHVIKNGVESENFVIPGAGNCWLIYRSIRDGYASSSLEEALIVIASGMGNWYTTAQAAECLVEMGVFDKPPTAKKICGWAKDGLLPGAMKASAPGQGGSWRVPEAALMALAERRKE